MAVEATTCNLPLLLFGLVANIAMLVLILAVALLGGADAQTETTIALAFAGLLVIASSMYVVLSRREPGDSRVLCAAIAGGCQPPPTSRVPCAAPR